jgi:acyl carrier protein
LAYNPRRFCQPPEPPLNTQQEVLALLDEILSLKGRTIGFSTDTPLLGAIPELDSMAVVALITGMEERFGFMTDDDEIDGSVFATVGSLVGFVEAKLAG